MTYSECLSALSICLQSMLIDCQEKNWESLSKNEKEREKLAEKLKSLSVDNSPVTIQLIKDIIDLNNQVITVADNNKDESEKTLLEIKRNIKKTSHYQ